MTVFSFEELLPDVHQLSFRGRLDSLGSEQVRSKLDQVISANGQLVIAEVSGVSQLPSPGIRLLLKLAISIKKSGGRLVIAAPRAQVEYALCVSGVDTEIPIYKTVEQAQAAII